MVALDGCPIGLHHCERGGPATNHQPTSDAQAQLGSHLRWRGRIDPSVWERSNGRNLAGRAAHGVSKRSGVELGEGTSMVWKSGCIHCQQPWRHRDRGRQVSSAAAVTWPHCACASFCGGPPCMIVSEPWRRSPSDWAARRRPHRLKSARQPAQLCRSAAKIAPGLRACLPPRPPRPHHPRPGDADVFRRRAVRPRCAAK